MPLVRNLPLFPLELVLYPHQRLQMHIFEDRYKAMTERCLANEEPFGIVFVNEGKMADIGCMARIRDVMTRYEDGRMDILVHGTERFRTIHLYYQEAYLTSDVETLVEAEEALNRDEKERAITQHMRLLELSGQEVRPGIYQHLPDVSFVLAENAGLTSGQKQKVLEMESENERLAFLTEHFESILPHIQELETLRKKIKSNGHFKDHE